MGSVKNLLKGLKTKATAVLAGVLLFVALFLVNALSHSHFLRHDFTQEKEFTLSSSTKKVLTSLDDNIVVKLYFTKKVPPSVVPIQQQIEDILEEFRVYSHGKLSIEKVFPEDGPDKERETQLLGIPPLQLNVVEQDKEEVQKLYMGMALFYADKKEVLPVIAETRHLEYDVVSALLKLTTKSIPVLGVVWPDNLPQDDSNPYSILGKILGKQLTVQNFRGDEPNLADEKLDGFMVVEPHESSPDITKNLDKLWEKGVPLIVLSGTVDVNQKMEAKRMKTGLEDWLVKMGLTVSKELVIEPNKENMGSAFISTGILQYRMAYPFFVKVPNNGMDSLSTITSRLEGITFPWPNVITVNSADHADWKYETLVQSSASSFLQEGEPQINPEVFENMTVQPGSRHPLSVLVEAPRAEGKPSRLVVVADHYFIQGNFMGDSEANLLFVQNMVDWLSWGDSLIGIRSRGKSDRPLAPLTPPEVAFIRWGHLIVLPLIVILCGFGISAYHRRRLVKDAKNL